MRINTTVKRAITRRQVAMTVKTATVTLDTNIGEYVEGVPTVVEAKGCFQQINRFDNYLGDELKQMTEGERLEASTVLWTLHPVKIGTGDTAKADIVTEVRTGRQYKVLAVRDKFYGNFYRAILGELRA